MYILNLRKFVTAIIFTVILTVILSSNSTAQSTIKIPGIEDIFNKPKDFNKPPDPNEFQQPVNGEYRANPTFFSARSDNERCNAIDLWLSSTRNEASKPSNYGSRSYLWQNGVLNMEGIDGQAIQNFATPNFRNIFGKGLSEFSEKEFKQVAKSLKKCSHQRWVANTLEQQFTNPSQIQGWIINFTKMEESVQKAKFEEVKKLYRERYQQEVRKTGYNVAELLKETEQFRLHAAFLNNGDTDWCSASDRQAVVGLILKKDENFRIENNKNYWDFFEKEMLPSIIAACNGVDKIYVFNYVDGFFINYDKNQIDEKTVPAYQSDVLNIGVFNINGQPKYSWLKGDRFPNLVVGYSQRTQRRVVFRDSTDNLINADQTATIFGLKQNFKINRERLAAEEKIRREKAEVEERERQKQIELAKEERRKKLALESKNGLEPNSEEMAIGFLRVTLAGVGCSNIVFNEVCKDFNGMTYKVIETKKIGCKMITKGKDYHCTFKFKTEVRGHPLFAPAMEFDLNSITPKLGYTKNGSSWSFYALTDEQRNALQF